MNRSLDYLVGFTLAIVIVIVTVLLTIWESPAPVEPDTLGLVACTAAGACRFLDLSAPPPDGAILFVPDAWYRDLQRERDSLETVIGKLRRWK
jgi:hypothetical protein